VYLKLSKQKVEKNCKNSLMDKVSIFQGIIDIEIEFHYQRHYVMMSNHIHMSLDIYISMFISQSWYNLKTVKSIILFYHMNNLILE